MKLRDDLRLLFLILLLALSSLECDRHRSPVEPVAKLSVTDLRLMVPLAVGNSWTYRHIECGIDGCDTTAESVQIVDTAWNNGREYFLYHGDPPHLSLPGGYFTEGADSADYSYYIGMGNDANAGESPVGTATQHLPIHLLKLPLEIGHQWRCAEWDCYDPT